MRKILVTGGAGYIDTHTLVELIANGYEPVVLDNPIMYYKNNVYGSMQLFKVMTIHNIKSIVFSSSATVYGKSTSLPHNEPMPTGQPTNPYGMSKLIIENMLNDIYNSDNEWHIINLRCFLSCRRP